MDIYKTTSRCIKIFQDNPSKSIAKNLLLLETCYDTFAISILSEEFVLNVTQSIYFFMNRRDGRHCSRRKGSN